MSLWGICFFIFDFSYNCFHILSLSRLLFKKNHTHKLSGITSLPKLSTFMHRVWFGNLLLLTKNRNQIVRLHKVNQSGYTSHQGFYQTYVWLDLVQICFTWSSCFNQILLSNMGTLVNNNKRWKFLNFWSLYYPSGFCLE